MIKNGKKNDLAILHRSVVDEDYRFSLELVRGIKDNGFPFNRELDNIQEPVPLPELVVVSISCQFA